MNRAYILATCWLISACGKDISTPFVGATDAPLAAPTSQMCRHDRNANRYVGPPEVISTVEYVEERHKVTGGGCVHRPIREVIAALQNDEAFSWKSVSLDNVAVVDAGADPLHFVANYSNVRMGRKNSWKMDWFHTIVEGNKAVPLKMIIRFQKTEGSDAIIDWRGVVQLEKIAENVTGITIENYIRGKSYPIIGEPVGQDVSKRSVLGLFEHASQLTPEWKYIGEHEFGSHSIGSSGK